MTDCEFCGEELCEHCLDCHNEDCADGTELCDDAYDDDECGLTGIRLSDYEDDEFYGEDEDDEEDW